VFFFSSLVDKKKEEEKKPYSCNRSFDNNYLSALTYGVVCTSCRIETNGVFRFFFSVVSGF